MKKVVKFLTPRKKNSDKKHQSKDIKTVTTHSTIVNQH